jgi:hypothetical protein
MLSNEALSLIVQLVCLALVGLYSVGYHDKVRNCVLVAVLLMVFANVFGQIVIVGDGPGALAGFLVLPLCGIMVSVACVHATRFLSVRMKGKQDNSHKPPPESEE